MKALILAADGVEDVEIQYPYYRLQEAGIEVDVAAPETGPIQGKHGPTVKANMAFSAAKAEDYDVLVLPGGKAPETVRLSDKAVQITKRMMDAGKTVAALCHGPQVLISAGALKGRRATCWPALRDDLKAAGAKYEDSEVVVDGNLITSRMPDDLPAFCRELMKALAK